VTGHGGLFGGGGGGAGGNNGVGGYGAVGIIVITYGRQHTTIRFTKDVLITGSTTIVGGLAKGSGSFVIDHPLDPKNKLLYHSFVESPDVKNIYDGTATLDRNGEAVIPLPDYFLALNRDFRYLATGMSDAMPDLHLARGVHRKWFIFGPVFTVAGGTPGGTISWQVTGIRKDPLILKNPIIPEVMKGPGRPVDKGHCLFPPLCSP
jgi:hypothetical protein